MSDSPEPSDNKKAPPDKSTVVLLFAIAADTTWRMFLPIISLALLGVWADNAWSTKPWLTVIGLVLGIVIATVLVIRQLNRK